jgi:fucose 4-O-acetylase-like acetyltransferase
MIYGNGFAGWMDFNIPLWFLPCLFCSCVMFFITIKVAHKLASYKQAIVFVSLGIIGYEISKYYRLPWGADVSLVAQVFLFAGYRFKNIEIPKSINKYILIAFLIILQALIIIQNGKVDMNGRLYGNLFLYYAGGILGSFAIINMSTCFIALNYINIFMSYIGNNSLQIFALHSLAFELLFIITPYLPSSLVANYYFSLIYYILGAILVSIFFSKLFENKMPPEKNRGMGDINTT